MSFGPPAPVTLRERMCDQQLPPFSQDLPADENALRRQFTRLYLKAHPDKFIKGNISLANEVTQALNTQRASLGGVDRRCTSTTDHERARVHELLLKEQRELREPPGSTAPAPPPPAAPPGEPAAPPPEGPKRTRTVPAAKTFTRSFKPVHHPPEPPSGPPLVGKTAVAMAQAGQQDMAGYFVTTVPRRAWLGLIISRPGMANRAIYAQVINVNNGHTYCFDCEYMGRGERHMTTKVSAQEVQLGMWLTARMEARHAAGESWDDAFWLTVHPLMRANLRVPGNTESPYLHDMVRQDIENMRQHFKLG